MEVSMLRSLMDKGFYDDHRGAKCPDRLFSSDNRKISRRLTRLWITTTVVSHPTRCKPCSFWQPHDDDGAEDGWQPLRPTQA